MKISLSRSLSQALMFAVAATSVHGATTSLATAPLVTSSSTSVKPNILFVLDDSGSMDWDFMPDWACASQSRRNSSCSNTGEDPSSTRYEYMFKNADYNGVYYNPANVYAPPIYYDADGTLNTTTYPSMTGISTSTGGDSSATSSARNWKAVMDDAYGVQSASTTKSDLTNIAYFWTTIAGVYCSTPALRQSTCATQAAATTGKPYAAKIRWCNTAGDTTAAEATTLACQGSFNSSGTTTYMRVRAPVPNKGSITITGGGTITGLTLGGTQIMAAATATSTTTSTVASRVADEINKCTVAATGACGTSGYTAYASGSTVYIGAPNGSTTTSTPTKSGGTATMTATAFPGASVVAGTTLQTVINSNRTSYPFPGSATKATTRTDCAGTTCTYEEEMTNYANWWTYYSSRMQMMKTSASAAFANLGSTYRTGYLSMNNNTAADFLNISDFDNTQKKSWYDKLFAADPSSSTPLRGALAKAGRLYAGKYNGSTLNGSEVVDPMQYSCQQNFTILSTDGYWNESSNPKRLDGSTDIGQQDGMEPRPYNDGANVIGTSITPWSKVDRQQSVTPISTVTPWTRTVTSVSATANCSSSSAATCLPDNGVNSASGTKVRTWCITTTTADGNDCLTLNNSGSTKVYACRGSGSTTDKPSGGSGCKTDSDTGEVWCIYNNSSTAGTSSCSRVYTGNNLFACKTTASTGYTVSVQNQTYNQTATGSRTSVDDVTSSYNVTVVTTNGVAAPAITSATTTSTANVTPAVDTYTTDTGAPTGATAYTNTGSPTTSCMASPPAASTTTATAGTAATTTSAQVVSVLSAGTYAAGTPTTTTTSGTGGVSNVLADVAEYYYNTDLRTSSLSNCTGTPVPPATSGNDVCSNDVPSSGLDGQSQQHMTTFTLGLGASGQMLYAPGYASATSGDYFDVANGTSANPASGICSWQASGSCNWPTPVSNTQTTIDDLWHAAVNGRGTYYSASNPATLSSGLSSALAGVSARLGASAAATTSNPNVTSGDNFVFSSTFVTQEWSGQLVRNQIDLVTGVVSSTIDWDARELLDAKASRTIYTFDGSAADKLKSFTWGNLSTGEQAYFSTPNISTLSQFCSSGVTCLSSANQTAAEGSSLVNFVRGDRTNEGVSTDTTKYYRQRTHVLGDIVNAEAVYVKKSLFDYADRGYSSYKSANDTRQGMAYVASNDGMLHAFYAADGAAASGIVGGDEAWAYVPTMVMSNLYKLADKNYSAQHTYQVDGTPVVGEICTANCAATDTGTVVWKTIVVGGLNAGGRGYYALDITNPTSPKALWEFTDDNLGYTYGNPEIAKLADGTWVVMFASGYNNVSPGDGVGRLFILNANTGALIRSISTSVGTTTTPSGLARIRAWVENATSDNTAVRVYGGDLLGNLWRFDINDAVGAAGYDAQRLVTLYSNAAGTTTQPITTKPELGEVSGAAVVYVGTGRYLGTPDLGDTSLQSFYAVKDALGTTALGNPRTVSTNFVQQTQTTTTCPSGSPATICTSGQVVRTSTNNTVNFSSNNGWFIDLPDSGERSNTDATLALGTLGFTTNVPNTSACTAGGYSYRYFLDYRTGAPVSTSTTSVVGVKLGNALATRGVFVRLPNNTVVQLTRLSDGSTVTSNVPIGSGAGTTRRVSWRELIVE